ncbi:MAG: LAGLIDADG family homing endonuclease [Candidatus Diapherotrites archaeon]
MDKELVDISRISFSSVDRKKGIKFPREMSAELAEEFGIHVGDGGLYLYRLPHRNIINYTISSGKDELDYVKHLKKLMKKVYNLDTKIYEKKDCLQLVYSSKVLLQFKKALGFPIGSKNKIQIPDCVLKSDFVSDFLRGLIDTDGCLQFQKKYKKIKYYPRIDIASKSRRLIEQVNEILLNMGFTTCVQYDKPGVASNGTMCFINRVYISGKKNLGRWVDSIGFSNPKNLKKLEAWLEKGYVK